MSTRLSVSSAHPGRRLSLCPKSTQTHTVKFHTYAEWIINTELDPAPLRKSPRVQHCLNSGAAVTRQADATHAPNSDEVNVEKRASGDATDNIFTDECQGAEIVSIGFVLLFVHCVLCSPPLRGSAAMLGFGSGGRHEATETTRNRFIAVFIFIFLNRLLKFLSSDSGLEASPGVNDFQIFWHSYQCCLWLWLHKGHSLPDHDGFITFHSSCHGSPPHRNPC